ncbi:hypothetical protein SNEBB_006857 [Seison nebaliae]|nr:hypothetical protein SNEBB_006857 [Seison nebaliae]
MYYFYFSCIYLITISSILNYCGCIEKITFIPDVLQYYFETGMRQSSSHERNRRRVIDTKKPEIELISKIPNFPNCKLRMIEMTDKYLDPHAIHAVYEAHNIKKHAFCTTEESNRVRYHNYHKAIVLGKGVQGTVYKIVNREGRPPEAVMKTYDYHGDFIMQVNAQYALNRLIPSFQLLGVLRGVDKSKTRMRNDGYMYEVVGTSCMMTEYIRGVIIGGTSLLTKQNKNKISFLILLLRQLQALHFSYNHYAIFPRTPSFTNYTFTLYHGDLHSHNLIVTENGDPRLIDIGAPIWKVLKDYGMVMLMQYNYYLSKDIRIEDKKRYMVHQNSLMNHQQANDFCKVLLIILEMISDMKLGRGLREICREMGAFFLRKDKLMDIPRRPLERLYQYYSHSPLWPFIPIVLRLSQPFREYRDSWAFFYKYFYQ